MTFLLAIWRSSAGHRRRHLVEPVRYAWDWRRGVRVVEQDNASDYAEGCDIKGNINRDGKMIYHVPGGRWYEQTRIDESAGERWFCSEDKAQEAGWRRSQE